MKIIKLWCHIKAAIKKAGYKVIFGKKVKVGKGTTWRYGFHIAIEKQGKIVIGENCFFNNGCSINALESVEIGDGTIFGSNVHVYDHNHRFRDENESIKDQGYTVAPTKIGSHCWLGTNVVVLKGVTIGDNCTIGTGMVVRCDVPDGSVIK
jgi:acetyltransferase-like isoleucine patch superfamily enzyme